MKKLKVFDVVKLNTEEMATITKTNSSDYDVSITDDQGKIIEIRKIKSDEIKDIIYSK